MKFGINTFPTDFGITPSTLGQVVEELGFESLLFAEHTHIPTSRRSKFPYSEDINQDYWRNLDPFIALAYAASATQHLLIGTGICLVVQRDPIILAKEVATLDHLSNGRVLFGVGGGWNLEEMENHGTNPSQRWKLMRERVEAMKTIWAYDEATYQGDFVNFNSIWQWPKPIQKPHPPILIAGDGQNTLKRIVRYGNGWMPLATYDSNNLSEFKNRIAELNRMAADAGRESIPVTVSAVPPDIETLKRYEDAGVERALFWLDSGTKEDVLPTLEQYANLARQLA